MNKNRFEYLKKLNIFNAVKVNESEYKDEYKE